MNPYEAKADLGDNVSLRLTGKRRLPGGMMFFLDVLVIVVSILWMYVTPGLDGGAFGWITAAVVLPAFLLLVLLAILGCRNHWLERWFNYFSLLVMCLPVAKTVADILWNTNHALLR